MRVLFTVACEGRAVDLIDDICDSLNYHKIRLNGNSTVNTSSLLRYIFESGRKDKILSFLKTLDLKDTHSEPIPEQKLVEIVNRIMK